MEFVRPDHLKWRARLKSTPTGRRWFRIGVALLGLALLIAAPLTGWIPGPGGIPLFLAGLAILSSEFLWAKSINKWLLRYVRVYLNWNISQQRLFWVGFFAILGIIWWIWLAIMGLPGWLPDWAATVLRFLPGVD